MFAVDSSYCCGGIRAGRMPVGTKGGGPRAPQTVPGAVLDGSRGLRVSRECWGELGLERGAILFLSC